ncbi:hypothetical protein HUT19_40930 [Streptomyces sp. NA02950]|uniref:hypothetical protein n=1 Tax=Streptomyces sp. NA02950 TaxID=2742137 RepID=UPI0015925473|nr:hypothetical protein [Streptomyces sp. NA02950]QKV90416.1 hypothetical protein HUT19_00290 [Streptomyces sp. NA02950]QKV97251.1 hypothetical protein HUT19_40930 [Streptomyces sp. NA02950]
MNSLPPSNDRAALVMAAHELRSALQQAGINGPCPAIGLHGPLIGLSTVTSAEAVELARLIRKGMRETFKVARRLRRGFLAHDLDVPDLKVDSGRIMLGEVSVPTAARLAILLGAPRDEVEAGADARECAARWAHQVRVRDLLSDAYKAVTGCLLVDLYAHPDCIRCNQEPAIQLGTIDIDPAQRLLATLRGTVP